MSSPTVPTIHTVIESLAEDEDYISQLNTLYEQLLEAKIDSINEATRTQVVRQNPNFPGIAGSISEDTNSESTTTTQSGLVESGLPTISGGSNGSY